MTNTVQASNVLQTYDLHVLWSIYVQTRDKNSLLRVHLPPISAVLENLAIPSQIIRPDYNPSMFRIIAYQNYKNVTIKEAIPTILASAYCLANNWNIGGLGCLSTGKYRHVTGLWSKQKPSPKPPALESMMFEVDRGLVRGVSPEGGVMIDDVDWNDGTEDVVKNELRLRRPPISDD